MQLGTLVNPRIEGNLAVGYDAVFHAEKIVGGVVRGNVSIPNGPESRGQASGAEGDP